MTHVPEPTDPATEIERLRAEVERLRGALERIRAEHTSDGHCNLLCPVCRAAGDRWPCTTWLEAQAALLPPPKEPPDAQVRPR